MLVDSRKLMAQSLVRVARKAARTPSASGASEIWASSHAKASLYAELYAALSSRAFVSTPIISLSLYRANDHRSSKASCFETTQLKPRAAPAPIGCPASMVEGSTTPPKYCT